MSFKAEMITAAGMTRLLQVHIERYLKESTEAIYILFLGDVGVALEIERLAMHSADASKKLDLVTTKYQHVLLLFKRLHEIVGFLPWIYDVDQQRFSFKTTVQNRTLLAPKGKTGAVLKSDAVHPADAVLLESLKAAPTTSKTQQFELRMLNADGLYQPYLHWASYQPENRIWEGMWLALPSAQFSNGNPFLDLQAVWETLSYGIVQITRFGLKLQFASALAMDMLALQTDELGLPIESIGSLKDTAFSKACQKMVLEEHMELEYYHASGRLWLDLQLYADAAQITILMSKPNASRHG